jgi:hypothetical protein
MDMIERERKFSHEPQKNTSLIHLHIHSGGNSVRHVSVASPLHPVGSFADEHYARGFGKPDRNPGFAHLRPGDISSCGAANIRDGDRGFLLALESCLAGRGSQ